MKGYLSLCHKSEDTKKILFNRIFNDFISTPRVQMKIVGEPAMAQNDKGVISVRFNQDHSCFTCCMESGLRIYNVDPLVEKAHYDVDVMGSVVQCEMLHRTNLLAVIPGGGRPRYPCNTVLVYDDLTKALVLDFTFTSPVKAVRMRRDR